VCLTNYEMLTNEFQVCYLELNCLLYCKVNTNWKFALSSVSQCKTGIQVHVWSASYFYFLNSIVLSIPLKSNAPLKKSEEYYISLTIIGKTTLSLYQFFVIQLYYPLTWLPGMFSPFVFCNFQWSRKPQKIVT
jgi:hypothetical protein